MTPTPALAATDARAQRLELALAFLLGSLPFCVVVRLPPNPGFWGQWVAVTMALLWLALRRPGLRSLPWPAGVFLALAALLLGQMAAGLAALPASTGVAAALLAAAAAIVVTSASLAGTAESARLLAAFGWGLIVALLLNAVSVVFGWMGYEFHFYWLYPAPAMSRAVGLIGQANHLGVLAVLAAFAAFHLHGVGRLRTGGFWFVSTVAAVVCIASSSRIALIVWAACAVLSFLWQAKDDDLGRRGRRLIGAQLALLAAAFVAGQAMLLSTAPAGTAGGAASVLRSDAGRVEMLHDAWAEWRHHPLFGIGHGNYAKGRLTELDTPLPAPHADNAHNLFAQALAEWGAVGGVITIAGVAGLLLLVRRRLRDPQRSPQDLYAAVWVVAVLTHSMVEHPLWSSHFLLPFALMVGALCRQREEPAAQPQLRAPAAAAAACLVALALSAVAAWDYSRSQSIALGILAEGDLPPGSPAIIRLADVARVDQLTLYPVFSKVQLARKLPLGDQAAGAKLELARQAMHAIPNGETIARFVAFAVVAGRADEAQTLLDRLARRSPDYYQSAARLLQAWARMDPRVAAFVAARAAAGEKAPSIPPA